MALPVLVQVTGAVTINPVVQGQGAPSIMDTMQLFVRASYNASKAARPSIASTLEAPYVVPLEGIARARFIAIDTGGATIRIRISTPNGGANQIIPCSHIFVWHAPAAGDEITALALIGSGNPTYLIGGESA